MTIESPQEVHVELDLATRKAVAAIKRWTDTALDDTINLVWALGEMPVLVVLMATVAQWARADERAAAWAYAEPGLAAYNDMLAELAHPTSR